MGEKYSEKIAIPLENMVCSYLSLEINSNFHIEALKAHAVVIRTNILKGSKPMEGNGLEEISMDVEYWRKALKAVTETQGILITFNGKPIDAKYHLTCGGSTENSENVTGNQISYIRRVLCHYCQDSPYIQLEKSYTINELESLLRVKFPKFNTDNIGAISGFIDEIDKDEYNRVKSIKIGEKQFSGKDLSQLLNIDCTRFSIYPTQVKIISKGKGHGMGLCLYGANTMAKEGYSYEDIIKYYYTGVEIEKVKLPSIEKPLFGKKIMLDPGHGGEDFGFKGEGLGLLEKDITLTISLNLKEKLKRLGAIVYLTRDSDREVLSTRRLEQANKINPDFFISIHMDYYPKSTRQGVGLFHFRNDQESKRLGLNIIDNLKNRQIKTHGLKEGNYFPLRGVGTNSLLIEAGFLSSKDEQKNFKDENYIKELTDGIVDGFVEHYRI